MTHLSTLTPFMGSLDALTTRVDGPKASYVQPALKNLGTVIIPLLREVVSPASFRNEQAEITDIDAGGVRRVRAVANKFKYGERQRGLQILRFFGAGGAYPQNRTELPKGGTAGAAFDLNTVIFGDSTDAAGKVLPVKAAALYSDAISLAPYGACVDQTFHNRAAEDGTLFDAETKKNSNNLFDRHFVKPGTLLVQTIAFTGRTAPMEALEHLLLCIGLAGAYGGQTSINGINVRTHICGIYAAPMERDLASPYVLAERLSAEGVSEASAAETLAAIERIFAASHPVSVTGAEASAVRDALITALEADDSGLRTRYGETRTKVAAYFDAWFEGIRG